jgi:hypothetical protein
MNLKLQLHCNMLTPCASAIVFSFPSTHNNASVSGTMFKIARNDEKVGRQNEKGGRQKTKARTPLVRSSRCLLPERSKCVHYS